MSFTDYLLNINYLIVSLYNLIFIVDVLTDFQTSWKCSSCQSQYTIGVEIKV